MAVALVVLVMALPAAATGAGPVLQGTLEVDDRPVAGVTISVSAAGGDEVGSDTTDRSGEWAVALPGAGEYTVVLYDTTRPEGVTVATEPVLDDVEVGSGGRVCGTSASRTRPTHARHSCPAASSSGSRSRAPLPWSLTSCCSTR